MIGLVGKPGFKNPTVTKFLPNRKKWRKFTRFVFRKCIIFCAAKIVLGEKYIIIKIKGGLKSWPNREQGKTVSFDFYTFQKQYRLPLLEATGIPEIHCLLGN